jgi:DNA-binding CsgD family transcriptional regulator
VRSDNELFKERNVNADLSLWWRDVSTSFSQVVTEASLLEQMHHFGKRLGFDYVAVGAKGMAITGKQDAALIISNYPSAWLERYMHAGYLAVDPTVRIGTRSRNAIIWSDAIFSKAQDFELRAGVAQSSWARGGVFTLLSLARSQSPVTPVEAHELQPHLLMLAEFVTSKLQNLIDSENSKRYRHQLSPREIEVLKWSAQGKTTYELSAMLGVASATVQFHVQNAKRKLGVTTKTQATDYARRLGLID